MDACRVRETTCRFDSARLFAIRSPCLVPPVVKPASSSAHPTLDDYPAQDEISNCSVEFPKIRLRNILRRQLAIRADDWRVA